MKMSVIGCSPAWPNPGAPTRLPHRALRRTARRLRPGVLPRLRQRGGGGRTSMRSRSPTSISTTGGSRPVGVGGHVSLGRIGSSAIAPSSGCTRVAGRSWKTSASGSASGTCSIASSPSTRDPPKNRSGGGFEVVPMRLRTTPSRRTGSGSRPTVWRRSPYPRQRPERATGELAEDFRPPSSARPRLRAASTMDLFGRPQRRGGARAAWTKRSGCFSRIVRPTHAPPGVERARDGLEIDL